MKTNMVSGDAREWQEGSETIIEFMNRVEITRGNDDIIETTPAIIKHFNPRGLGTATHFTYKGLIVCEEGRRPEVEKNLAMTLEEKMHPKTT